MLKKVQPTNSDINHITELLIHGHLTDLYSLKKVNVALPGAKKLNFRDILIVLQIGLEPEITSSKLSELFRISTPLLSTRISSLMRLDLIKQVEDPDDRRIHKLLLRSAGTTLFNEWYQHIKNFAVDILNDFPRASIDEMEHIIDFIVKHAVTGLGNHKA
ncbi:MarR family winged helix-turn-helix transcriptional regulator [Furfurilactobacillus siliginis]|uniref:HTH marR-type domain-containing protein n=1 Tax=Furfurilactobacillus siliginis TaxID=348151 RepID=A0A0R2L6N2_9LACO|nr:helix-turn-helix domain-containing protein [Furfurilactobacillus siliginis]KRN97331.1 hypothetical protein IV55_GL000259 [Furfurilactobacillus siliginis]GEK29184.1 hypothetical protein LSI01_14950 [Furfurilactobacillus siliginis]